MATRFATLTSALSGALSSATSAVGSLAGDLFSLDDQYASTTEDDTTYTNALDLTRDTRESVGTIPSREGTRSDRGTYDSLNDTDVFRGASAPPFEDLEEVRSPTADDVFMRRNARLNIPRRLSTSSTSPTAISQQEFQGDNRPLRLDRSPSTRVSLPTSSLPPIVPRTIPLTRVTSPTSPTRVTSSLPLGATRTLGDRRVSDTSLRTLPSARTEERSSSPGRITTPTILPPSRITGISTVPPTRSSASTYVSSLPSTIATRSSVPRPSLPSIVTRPSPITSSAIRSSLPSTRSSLPSTRGIPSRSRSSIPIKRTASTQGKETSFTMDGSNYSIMLNNINYMSCSDISPLVDDLLKMQADMTPEAYDIVKRIKSKISSTSVIGQNKSTDVKNSVQALINIDALTDMDKLVELQFHVDESYNMIFIVNPESSLNAIIRYITSSRSVVIADLESLVRVSDRGASETARIYLDNMKDFREINADFTKKTPSPPRTPSIDLVVSVNQDNRVTTLDVDLDSRMTVANLLSLIPEPRSSYKFALLTNISP